VLYSDRWSNNERACEVASESKICTVEWKIMMKTIVKIKLYLQTVQIFSRLPRASIEGARRCHFIENEKGVMRRQIIFCSTQSE
jgi:hypothetical protein